MSCVPCCLGREELCAVPFHPERCLVVLLFLFVVWYIRSETGTQMRLLISKILGLLTCESGL